MKVVDYLLHAIFVYAFDGCRPALLAYGSLLQRISQTCDQGADSKSHTDERDANIGQI